MWLRCRIATGIAVDHQSSIHRAAVAQRVRVDMHDRPGIMQRAMWLQQASRPKDANRNGSLEAFQLWSTEEAPVRGLKDRSLMERPVEQAFRHRTLVPDLASAHFYDPG